MALAPKSRGPHGLLPPKLRAANCKPARSTKQRSRASCRPATFPSSTYSSARRARSACRTSFCGRQLMPSSCSSTSSGRISTSRPSPTRWTNLPLASAASVADERAARPDPDRRRADRGRVGCGGCRADTCSPCWSRPMPLRCFTNGRESPGVGAQPGRSAASSMRCLPALALLWIRERDAHGLELLLWAFLVTWSTDIGAYFAGRASAGGSSRLRSVLERRWKDCMAGSPPQRS